MRTPRRARRGERLRERGAERLFHARRRSDRKDGHVRRTAREGIHERARRLQIERLAGDPVEVRRHWHHAARPVVLGDLAGELRRVRRELEAEARAALERALLKGAETERVDRRDRREIELTEGGLDAATAFVAIGDARGDGAEIVVARARRILEGLERLAKAAAELRGGGLGERDDDDLADRQALLHDEAEEERRDRVRLARPGAGLDERGTGELRLRGARGHHGTSFMCSRSGTNTRSASSTKLGGSSSDGPSNRRNAGSVGSPSP